ncbi:unnamed protein product [Schistosoma intercalatum]|nr:unnamed protein product [Schistosoma intercalatum]CAH8566128.1 unnamed protein product [Schistosoma intercalatum]
MSLRFLQMFLSQKLCFLCDYIENNNLEMCIPKHYLKDLLLQCALNVQFRFNDDFYRQTNGVGMGSSVGPLLADCLMANLRNSVLRPIIERFHLYKRCMDDTFIICEEDMDLNKVLKSFNNCHPSIQFTLEAEANNEFHFLDVRLKRMPDGFLKRSIYRKPNWNGQYTNFHGWVALSRKRKLIHSLSSRIR